MTQQEKHLIPNHLLPTRYHNKGYTITKDGKVFGVHGKEQKVSKYSPNGFMHPLILDKNLWWLRASMFVPNPNNWSHVIEKENGDVVWIPPEVYRKAVKEMMEKANSNTLKQILQYHEENKNDSLDMETNTDMTGIMYECQGNPEHVLQTFFATIQNNDTGEIIHDLRTHHYSMDICVVDVLERLDENYTLLQVSDDKGYSVTPKDLNL